MSYSLPDEVIVKGQQIFACDINGRRVFVKKRRANKNPAGWLAQKVLYHCTGNLLLIPPQRKTTDNVTFESKVLKSLYKHGLPVPDVLHVAKSYFVMSDAGQTLERVLKASPERGKELVAKAVLALKELHRSGFAHGGSQIKNITLLDERIHFIDFEEDIPINDIAKFQIRDLFLLLLSLEQHGQDPDLEAVCSLYEGGDGQATLRSLYAALKPLRFIRLLESRLFSRFRMRDVRSLISLVRKAENLLPPAA